MRHVAFWPVHGAQTPPQPKGGPRVAISGVLTRVPKNGLLFPALLELSLLREQTGLPCRSHLERQPGESDWTIVLRAGLSSADREGEIRRALSIVLGMGDAEANCPTLSRSRERPWTGQSPDSAARPRR